MATVERVERRVIEPEDLFPGLYVEFTTRAWDADNPKVTTDAVVRGEVSVVMRAGDVVSIGLRGDSRFKVTPGSAIYELDTDWEH